MKRFKPLQQYDFVSGAFISTKQSKPTKKKKTTTNSLTATIADYIAMQGGYAMRINVAGFYRENVGYIKSGSTVGTPDLIAVVRGRLIGIEIKTGKDRLSEAQKYVQERINQAQGVYIIAQDFDTFKSKFEAIVKSF